MSILKSGDEMRCCEVIQIFVKPVRILAQSMMIMASLSCAAKGPIAYAVEPYATPSESAALDTSCKYLRFALATEVPGFVRGDGLAEVAITREIELLYAEEFERVGFDMVSPGEIYWMYLRANLMKSPVRPDNLVGSMEFASTSELHRDYSLALMSGEVPVAPIGVIMATEIATQKGRVQFLDGARADARKAAEWALSISTPALAGLCGWEKQVVDEGVTIEELREKLVAEMVRVRQARREKKQSKELKIEIEKHG